MPIHDWTRVSAGIFYAFHTAWIGDLQRSLNNGVLPPDYYALAEQVAVTIGNPDVLALRSRRVPANDEGGVAVATMPPHLAVHAVAAAAPRTYFPRRQIMVRHVSGDQPVALIEIVSPANKDRAESVDQFVSKIELALADGLHIQVIDLLAPGKADPDGMHAAVWSRLGGTFKPDARMPLTLSAYVADDPVGCYVEPTAVGLTLIDLPLFLTPQRYVNVPLEGTYTAAFQALPQRWKSVIEAA